MAAHGQQEQASDTAMWQAASDGDIAALEELLGSAQESRRRAMIEAADEEGVTALMLASENGHADAMRVLLNHTSADAASMVVVTHRRGRSAAMLAAASGHVECVRLVLDHPSTDAAAQMMMQEREGCSALMLASEHGHVDVMRLLLGHPTADIPAMMMLVKNSGCPGDTALSLAVWRCHVDAVRRLLDHPSADAAAMMMHRSNDDTNALTLAAEKGHVDIMYLILDHLSADPATMKMLHMNEDGFTTSMVAAYFGRAGALRLLLVHPCADPAAMVIQEDRRGNTALMLAAEFATGRPDNDEPSHLPSCTPLLLLLARVAMEAQPSDAQKAHMSKVMKALCEGPHLVEPFDDGQPDEVRDDCIRLLPAHGADMFVDETARPVVARIVREQFSNTDAQMARVPQLHQ